VIGLAGGVGAGKSAVGRALAELGCVVADCDALAQSALDDPAVRTRLRAWWGCGILAEDGRIDRGAVADIVFADDEQRRLLERLVHPWVRSRLRERFRDTPAAAPALVIDAPLLFEAGLEEVCDAVIFVDAERDVRLRRVAASRGWDARELRRREDSQMPLDVKRGKADHVVENNGDFADLSEKVRHILSDIIRSQRRHVDTPPS
jgi:dephospho-CoA kinase